MATKSERQAEFKRKVKNFYQAYRYKLEDAGIPWNDRYLKKHKAERSRIYQAFFTEYWKKPRLALKHLTRKRRKDEAKEYYEKHRGVAGIRQLFK